MQNVGLILLVFAFVMALIAGCFRTQLNPNFHAGWLAVAFWVASELLGGLSRGIH
jgi:hypothetical protein